MKRVKTFLINLCVYSVLILALFCVISGFENIATPSIPVSRVYLIFLYSALIAGANFILEIKRLGSLIGNAIHFLSLLLAFVMIFIFAGSESDNNISKVLVSIFLFTILYLGLRALGWLVSKWSKKLEGNHDKKQGETYRPSFSDNDKPSGDAK